MIVKKQLLLLIYTLQIIYVLGEDSLIDPKENETNSSRKIVSLDRIDYFTSPKVNDTYPKTENLETESFLCNTTDHKTVQNLTVDFVSTEWILLSWQPPCENPINESFTYLIYVCSNEKCFQTNEKNTRYNASNLDPCTEYEFTVKVAQTHPELDGVNVTAKTNYNITEIGDVQDLLVHTTTSTINLSWRAPSKYPECVQNYLLTICSNKTCDSQYTIHKEYIAKDLVPCTKYSVIIRAVSYIVKSDGLNITLKTNSPKSSKPRDPTVEASATSLFIHWQPPEVGSMCITHYRVTINPETTTTISTETNITINNLRACTSYSVYINPVDQDNNDGDMVVINTKTIPTVSRPPILNNKESFVTMNTIMLSWKIEKGNSSCILTSLRALCNYTSTAGHGYEITNGQVEVPINSGIQDEFLFINSLIKEVSPFTTYICWAYVINEAGISELSKLTSFTTFEDIPSSPIATVRNVTYSQFEIAWETPAYLPGNLHEFEIVVEWEICFPIPDWCTLKPSRNSIHLNGSTFNFEYSSAIPYTNYTIKMKARTTAGWGNYSDNIVFQTPAGVPEMVSNFSYLIKNNEHDTNTLDTILNWGFPCSVNGIIEYFNVFVNGTRTNYAPDSFTNKQYIPNTISKNDIISINLKELKAEYNYTFEVSVKVKGVQDFGEPARHTVLYPAGSMYMNSNITSQLYLI